MPLRNLSELNEKAARLGYITCDICGEAIELYWVGQGEGLGPFIVSPDAPPVELKIRCRKHIETAMLDFTPPTE